MLKHIDTDSSSIYHFPGHATMRSSYISLLFLQIELSVAPDHWLSFTAEGVAGHTNVVAIDDISLYAGPCLDNTTVPDFRCNDGLTIPQEQVGSYE